MEETLVRKKEVLPTLALTKSLVTGRVATTMAMDWLTATVTAMV